MGSMGTAHHRPDGDGRVRRRRGQLISFGLSGPATLAVSGVFVVLLFVFASLLAFVLRVLRTFGFDQFEAELVAGADGDDQIARVHSGEEGVELVVLAGRHVDVLRGVAGGEVGRPTAHGGGRRLSGTTR